LDVFGIYGADVTTASYANPAEIASPADFGLPATFPALARVCGVAGGVVGVFGEDVTPTALARVCGVAGAEVPRVLLFLAVAASPKFSVLGARCVARLVLVDSRFFLGVSLSLDFDVCFVATKVQSSGSTFFKYAFPPGMSVCLK
jgi:hypothetical protein